MRVLSIMFAVPLLFGALFLTMGGIGPLMWFGHFTDQTVSEGSAVWVLVLIIAYGYVLVFWLGLGVTVVFWGGLARAYATAVERPWHWADSVLIAGHGIFVLSSIHWLLGRMAGYDLMYLLLMLAALGYSTGLGALALTFRSRQDRPQAAGPLS